MDVARLEGKSALITGGSRGLGLQISNTLAEQGASVIIASRKIDACITAAEEISSRHGVKAVPVAVNVSSWQDCDRLVDEAYAHSRKIDILVNNAGVSPLYPTIEDVSEDLYDKVFNVNLRGPFRLMSRIGTRMRGDGGGAIINISSMLADRPTPDVIPYAAAKAGLNSMTRGFAIELGPTVRVNSIVCGRFRTDVSAAWGDEAAIDAMARRTTILQRFGSPADIAGAALYFASDSSRFCTGSLLHLDGGGFWEGNPT
jgi:NAD(P)-dependent dehydrogenase (short-subunit alcohol dehydrogenase family)